MTANYFTYDVNDRVYSSECDSRALNLDRFLDRLNDIPKLLSNRSDEYATTINQSFATARSEIKWLRSSCSYEWCNDIVIPRTVSLLQHHKWKKTRGVTTENSAAILAKLLHPQLQLQIPRNAEQIISSLSEEYQQCRVKHPELAFLIDKYEKV